MLEFEDGMVFQTESIDYGSSRRLRTTGVVGNIGITTKQRENSKNTPLALINGFKSGSIDPRPVNIEGGHLMGLKLGGVDNPLNIVPMYSHVNRGTFSGVESSVLSSYATGKSMALKVELEYSSTDARIPSKIKTTLLSGIPTITLDNWSKLPTGTVVKTWTTDNAPQPATKIAIDPHKRAYLLQAQNTVEKEGFTLEKNGFPVSSVSDGVLPPLNSRPYALLDAIYILNPKNKFFPMGSGSGMPSAFTRGGYFTDKQRAYIQEVNRYMQADDTKRGECYSDRADDPNTTALIQLGTDTGIEIDHICSRVPVGANAFSNAQLVSAGYNRSKSTN
ncbi:MAG: DNA/RNA non-specific endonuclease [Pseudomonadota bacterium]